MNTKNIARAMIISALLLPIVALAQGAGVQPIPVTNGITLTGILTTLQNAILLIGGAMAVIMFVWAGITFLLANGAPEKVGQVRQAFLWGVVGVAVMIIGTGIVMLVSRLVTGGSTF